MSTPLLQGDGPFLGPISIGTERFEADVKMKGVSQPKLYIETGGFVDLKKKSKVFTEGPPMPPQSPTQGQSLLTTPDLYGFKKPSFVQPSNNYIPGLVKVTGKVAVVELAETLNKISIGTTGAIIEEGLVPTCDEYSEGVHFLVEKKLSKGSFGFGEICIDAGKRFFRKKMCKENFRSSEVTVPINLNHENVTKVYGLIQREEPNKQITVELLIEPAGVALNTFVQHNEIDDGMIWDFTKQAMAGFNHMHLYGMIHFDNKPENLCVQRKDNKLLLKITDFGSAKLPQQQLEFIGWTPEYMAPETSRIFLQKKGMLFQDEITEDNITGKVDVFAMALVIMYLYEKVHVLQRLITNGETSYAGMAIQTRMDLQLQLMKMLAEDPKFVQSIIPDKCDIDMRELLGNMTQYDHRRRYDALQIIQFIDRREQRRKEAIMECKKKSQLLQLEKQRMRMQEPAGLVPNVDTIRTDIPDIAYNCVEMDNGPIKIHTKDKLRQKLKPYPGKGKGKFVREETPMQELRRMQAASKTMDDFQCPPTPVTDVSLSLAKLNMTRSVNTTERNAPVTQPMTEETVQTYRSNGSSFQIQSPSQPSGSQFQNGSNTQQPVSDMYSIQTSGHPPQSRVVRPTTVAATAIKVERPNQDQQKLLMDLMLGKLKIAMSEKGPVLVKICEDNPQVVPSRRGVTPFMPASPQESSRNQQPNILQVDEATEDMGNVPDFFKLG